MIVFALISILAIKLLIVNGECGYYANSPIETCLAGNQYSNYYYCSNSVLYWKQYNTSNCSGVAAYDTLLCDADNSDCIGSCGEQCPYVLQTSYSSDTSTCNQATDDWNQVAYIMDYCHATSSAGTSFKFECTNISQLTFTTYSDNSCSGVVTTLSTYSVDNLPATDCLVTELVSNNCNETVTVYENNIQCPVHANVIPLEVCYGNYDPVGTSYSNYFYCDNEFLYQQQYANTDCSGDAAYDLKLCNSRFSECPIRCGEEKCEYFVRKVYGSGNNCDKNTDNWGEVIYPIGYCVVLTTMSLKAECNSNGVFTYTQYTDTECATVQSGFPKYVELTGNPTVDGADTCIVTSIYVTCPQSPSEQPSEQASVQPSESEAPSEQPSTSPIKTLGGGALRRYPAIFPIYWVVMLVLLMSNI